MLLSLPQSAEFQAVTELHVFLYCLGEVVKTPLKYTTGRSKVVPLPQRTKKESRDRIK